MTSDKSQKNYITHPLFQCLNKLGIEVNYTTFQELTVEPTIKVDDCIARLLDQQGVPYSTVAVYDENCLGLLTPPCLLHWNLNHFVVVSHIDRGGIQVWDPYLGECQYSCMEFMEFSQKPGYVNYAILLAPSSAPNTNVKRILTSLLDQEKSEERLLIKVLIPIASALSYLGKPVARLIIRQLIMLWDTLVRPRIFDGPQRNFSMLLRQDSKQARQLARLSIAELAITMGYTGFLLRKLKTPRTTVWADRVIATPLAALSSSFKGQCIVEMMHLFDPISTVYSVMKKLPDDRNFVVYGNPTDDSMIALCEQTCREQGRTLEILPPAERNSFLKLMKRAKSGSHILMFADGNPLIASEQASGLQMARSFGACELWQHKAYLTLTGALIAQKVDANLYVVGLTHRPCQSLTVHAIPVREQTLSGIMKHKAAAVEKLLEKSPHGWLFWRNADVYFHEYQSAY
ncbi:cysteine peptidase family C39 domain-containing protein [Vibrio splendidus]|uniref:cysteine peptidase family C39 domain-containing protein n=1 Tax=Vibrio splendidus TaxID=29497 RepID=UPI0034A0D071